VVVVVLDEVVLDDVLLAAVDSSVVAVVSGVVPGAVSDVFGWSRSPAAGSMAAA
jgi:hypothetical protein